MLFFPEKEKNDVFFPAFFSSLSLMPIRGRKGSEEHSCDIVSITGQSRFIGVTSAQPVPPFLWEARIV